MLNYSFLQCIFLILFYPRINQTNTTSLAFQVSEMGSTTSLAQLVSILRVKLSKVVIKGKISFFQSLGTSPQRIRFWGCDIFVSPSGCPINSIFQWQYIFIRFMFLMNYFSSNYENACGHQTFQGGDMLWVALTHKYTWHLNGVVLWGHVTNEIHISTCRRCINNTLGNMMT